MRVFILLALLAGGCAIRPARIGSRVEGVQEARQASAAQDAALAGAQSGAETARTEIAEVRRLTGANAAKAEIVLRWLRLRDRETYSHP